MSHDTAPVSTPRRILRRASRLVLLLLLVGALAALLPTVTGAAGTSVWALPLGVAMAVLGLWAYRIVIRRVDKREPLELSREGAAGIWWGTAAGIGLFTATIAAIAVFGGYRILGWGSFEAFLAVFGLMCAVGVAEELLFRGVIFRFLEETTGTWGALAVSAVLFGGAHMMNPNATLWGGLAIALEAGLMLGAAYVATRSLWLPIGIHIGWNAAQAGIFGTAVSGSEGAFAGLLLGETRGLTMIGGGAFGPEGSIFAVLFCGAVTVYLLRLAHRRGQIMARPSRRT